MDAALAPLRLLGICFLNFIDDWLILAQLQEMAVQQRDVILDYLRYLELRLNAKKIIFPAANYIPECGMGLNYNVGTDVFRSY